jgi:membrane associated rhomboid family serine protease
VIEHSNETHSFDYVKRYIRDSITEIESAEDYIELEYKLFSVLSMLDISFEQLEEFGAELEERSDSYYDDKSYAEMEVFFEWQHLREKEEKAFNGHVNFALGLRPTRMGRLHTYFTYQFLHGDIWHLLGNMLFLWVVGCLLEDSWGRIPFLVFYLFGGAFAGLAHCLQDTGSVVPLIGASGSIAAAMGAFAIRHFFTRIKFFYFFLFFFRPFWGTFFLPAYVFLPFWFFEQLVLRSISNYVGASGVAYMAHIAGFAGGVTVALFFRYSGFEEKYIAPLVQTKQIDAGVTKDPRFDEACDLIEKGEIENAKSIFAQLVNERPNDLDLLQDIAIIYKERGCTAECQQLAEHVLRGLLIKSDMENAATVVLRMIEPGEKLQLNVQALMRVAKWLTGQERYGEAHDVYRFVLSNDVPSNIYARAAIGLAQLYTEYLNNPRDAVEILEDTRYLAVDEEINRRIAEVEKRIIELYPNMAASMMK